MYVSPDSFDQVYKRVKSRAERDAARVLVFVAPDCDAMCAARILTVGVCDVCTFALHFGQS